jgi:hypothetical protein
MENRSIRRQLLLPLFLLVVCGACVERRLWVRTEPPGAVVRINGKEIGETPVAWSFQHYGTVRVEVDLSGYESVSRDVRLRSPWYQKPGVDFLADVVAPWTIEDEHELKLTLAPEGKLDVDREIRELGAAARAARAEVGTP